MKRFLVILIVLVVAGCRNNHSEYVMNSLGYESRYDTDTTAYPLFIEGGTKLVYQFGHLTPDKGLKLYYDTIPYPAKELKIDESVRRRLSAR